jgi:gamma-glutamylcyclotransferase (GGCT)/AIG2-like uncharacterized protein YtfP
MQDHFYFAYGSNMNAERAAARGLLTTAAAGATLQRVRLAFNKCSLDHAGMGHANICFDPDAAVEGVLYRLARPDAIRHMDIFEGTPVNYSRELVRVESAGMAVWAWTYVANPAVVMDGLRPAREYLAHLLAGRPYLSTGYFARLAAWPCHD